MCKILGIARSNYYYETKRKSKNHDYEKDVISAFKESKGIYGTRKIKAILNRKSIIISRRKISTIMHKNGLKSKYTVLRFRNNQSKVNQDKIDNILDRNFDHHQMHEVIVSDLTYVNVAGKWNYICLLIDLFNREIIGYSCGSNKTADLVHQAFMNSDICLMNIKLFHTDRGSEFKNKVIEELLTAFEIRRSLSQPGCPYDNAVAEATYKTFKTEFCNKRFESSSQLKTELFDYINWYNKIRIHGSLNYLSPVEYRKMLSI